MSVQDIHNARLQYLGGGVEGRMQKGKLNSLKKSLFNSYQAETAILADGRKFKCLINPSKLKADYDIKTISIPFADICLNEKELFEAATEEDIDSAMSVWTPRKTSEGIQEIGMKTGDVFEWEETHTHWLVDLRHIEEAAYFRAEIHRCDQQVTINGTDYWVYIRGPVETTEQWGKAKTFFYENLNYSLVMYITQNEQTLDYFHRNQKIKIDGDNWEVQSVNKYYLDGILQVCLKEDYNNPIEDEIQEEEENIESLIIGDTVVYPYEEHSYSIDRQDGEWRVNSPKATIVEGDKKKVSIFITTGRSGNFDLEYIVNNSVVESKHIIIKSL